MSIISDALKRAQLERSITTEGPRKKGTRKGIHKGLLAFFALTVLSSIALIILIPKTMTASKQKVNIPPKALKYLSLRKNESSPAVVQQDKAENKEDNIEKVIDKAPIKYSGNNIPTVQGIMYSSSMPQAIVNDRLIGEGAEINGFFIKSIYANEILAVKEEKEYRLTIK